MFCATGRWSGTTPTNRSSARRSRGSSPAAAGRRAGASARACGSSSSPSSRRDGGSPSSPTSPTTWSAGYEPWISRAPVHIVVGMREDDYHDRYREPDKLEGGEEIEWRVPWWWVDAGKAMMLLLLAAVDEGLGAGVFGCFRRRTTTGCATCSGSLRTSRSSEWSPSGHPAPEPQKERKKEALRAGDGRSRRSSAGSTGSRAGRRSNRRDVQPVPPFSPAARAAGGLSRVAARTRRSCSSARRPATAGRASAGFPSPPSAS